MFAPCPGYVLQQLATVSSFRCCHGRVCQGSWKCPAEGTRRVRRNPWTMLKDMPTRRITFSYVQLTTMYYNAISYYFHLLFVSCFIFDTFDWTFSRQAMQLPLLWSDSPWLYGWGSIRNAVRNMFDLNCDHFWSIFDRCLIYWHSVSHLSPCCRHLWGMLKE